MEAAAASAMDFHALSRRELQALCKRNGVRANMTNAAMAEALQGLASVDGIDEIGSTLCLPTAGRSTMKSAAKAAALAGEDQQQGSPLPRGRRVSVMSPAAIRMEVEEGDDEVKRDLVKEVVKTPGLALRSTSRRARATPAPLPTPTTLRRSQRTAARKAAAPVEAENRAEEVLTVQRTTRRASARSKMMMELEQEEEAPAAAPEEKAQELKADASDVKCDDLEEEEEVTKVLEGSNKEEEPEEGEEADSSDATNGSEVVSDKSCDDLAVVVDQEVTKLQEGTVEEQEPISVEKCAPLAPLEDSPILGVLSKSEATESIVEKAQDATVEDDEGDEWSPFNEMTDEIIPVNEMTVEVNPVSGIKTDVGDDVTKEEGEIVQSPKEVQTAAAAAAEDETSETSRCLNEEKEGAADEMPHAKLTEDEISEDDELDGDEERTSDEEGDFTDGSDDENDETNEERDCTEGITNPNQEKKLVQMLQETVIAGEATEDGSEEEAGEDGSEEEVSEDGSEEEASEAVSDEEASEAVSDEEASDNVLDEEASEDDDFSGDLPPEFDNVVVLSDAETDSDTTVPMPDENHAIFSSATRSVVLDDSVISEVKEVSSEEVSEGADLNEEAAKEVDTIVKSLDEFTIKEAEELQKQMKHEDLHSKSLRQLKSMVKDAMKAKEGKQQVAAQGGKRLPLTEVDDNASVDC